MVDAVFYLLSIADEGSTGTRQPGVTLKDLEGRRIR